MLVFFVFFCPQAYTFPGLCGIINTKRLFYELPFQELNDDTKTISA